MISIRSSRAAVDVHSCSSGRRHPGRRRSGDLARLEDTIADLAALRADGLDIDIAAHVRRGGTVLGLCGGYQMLGHAIADPGGIEGPAGKVPGLGLLDVETVLARQKTLDARARRDKRWNLVLGATRCIWASRRGRTARVPSRILPTNAGRRVSANGRVIGTYVHGLFADDKQRAAWLARGRGSVAVAYGRAGGGDARSARRRILRPPSISIGLLSLAKN